MDSVVDILAKITKEGQASDIFIVAGRPLSYKANGAIYEEGTERLMPANTQELITAIYELAGNQSMERIQKTGDDDFSFAIRGVARFRMSTYKQRGSLSAVIRVINFNIPDPNDLGIPDSIIHLADRKKGLVLVTGPAGSGKSTTLACMVDHINSTRQAHIITLEDPLEYLHMHKKSIVSQREVISDTDSYLTALRASLRQSPDVILLGEMRDSETISVAMTAAETGHLVLSTLHTIGAANTIERIIDSFPPNQQHQIYIQLSMVLQAVVSQQLLPTEQGSIVPAFEIMTLNPAIRTNIRDQKVQSIDSIIDTSSQEGMISMNTSLLNLYNAGLISEKTAYSYTTNPDNLGNKLYYLGKRKTGGEITENEIAPDLKKAIKDKKKNKKAMSKEALSNLASAPSNDDAAYSGKWDDDWNDGDDWGDEKPETPEKPERSEKIDKSEKKDVKKEPAEKPAKEDKADKIRLLLDGSAGNAAAPKKHGLFGKKK
ncbi:MAG: PilT/PilU family type 4a pilus ATPase [Lachnospiraceae bacterium]|nr:PilT/PilU family type 4a pilus ATPase [Lachnospiraceae bacterium]